MDKDVETEKSAFPAPVRTTVHYRTEERLGLGESVHMSLDGMRLAATHPLPVGTRLSMSFSTFPAAAADVVLEGEVVALAEASSPGGLPYVLDVRFQSPFPRPGGERRPMPPDREHEDSGSQAVAFSKQRRSPRIPRVFRVSLRSQRHYLKEYTLNISGHGLFIRTDQEIDPQTPLDIELWVPELEKPVLLRGTVVYRRKESHDSLDKPPGIGVDLGESLPHELQLLHDLADKWLTEWAQLQTILDPGDS